jgi:cell division protein FtsI/penicillin-binding protein 2
VYLVLKDFVPTENAEYLMDVKNSLAENYTPGGDSLAGLEFKPHLARSYPGKTIAANLLGFVTLEGRGYFGVEEKYNDLLSGVPQRMWVPSNPNRVEEIPSIPAGASLVLTIDRELQLAVEEILFRSVANTGSASGTIIVMDPKTGEILAMASTPQLDPNQFWEYDQVYDNAMEYNRAISQIYEPGSIYKIFTLAAALDSGAVNANSSYLDIGFYSLGGAAIYNWDQGAWGQQNLVGCIQHSLNVCMSWLADTMGPETFYTYMRRFGIGHPTGTDMSGEASGRLKVPGDDDWHLVDLATNSFGQGVAVTPIQMMMAASAIANDGKMVLPHVVRSIISNGRQNDSSVQIIGTPISAETARLTSEILATAMENGQSLGLVPGYRIAAKTGTAQIPAPNGLYLRDQINASFLGWGPVDDPQFMVYVWLEKPQSEDWASLVAAPIFKEVVERTVVLLNIPPDAIRRQITGQ